MTELELLEKYVPKNKQKKALKKLKNNYPIQYIIGNVDFLDYKILVNKNVLIPRFETELLVDLTVKLIKKYHIKDLNILDLCTGSGCIAIAMKDLTKGNVDALDISKKAIKVAQKNAKINNTNINFIVSDLEKYIPSKKYSIIISNPPYVTKTEKVDPKTKYEPKLSLYADDNGLYFYKRILEIYPTYLEEKFLMAFEIGKTQGKKLKKIANNYFPTAKISIEKDLTGRDRYLFITNYE